MRVSDFSSQYSFRNFKKCEKKNRCWYRMLPLKRIDTKNTHVKYQSCITYMYGVNVTCINKTKYTHVKYQIHITNGVTVINITQCWITVVLSMMLPNSPMACFHKAFNSTSLIVIQALNISTRRKCTEYQYYLSSISNGALHDVE